jgi:hypothetical protein
MSYDATAGNVTLFLNGAALSRAVFQTTTFKPSTFNPIDTAYIGRCVVQNADSSGICLTSLIIADGATVFAKVLGRAKQFKNALIWV